MSAEALSGQQIVDSQLDGWTFILQYGLHGLQTRIHTKSFADGAKIVSRVGQAAEKLQHHADLDLRKSWIEVRLVSGYGAGGTTEVDVQLARAISAIAIAAGAHCEADSISRLELALDTPDHEKIAPFWAAVLDREYVSGDGWGDVGDKYQTQPIIWFQRSGAGEPRQRWHLDVWVDPSQIQPRIDAAIAAGGTRVSDATLSDPDGNNVCLCSWQGRA